MSERHKLLYPLLFLGLATTLHFLFPQALPSAVMYIARPLWISEAFVVDTWGKSLEFFRSKSALIDDVTSLTEELQKKDVQLLDRDILAEENRHLKEVFGRSEGGEGIIASVLTTPPHSLYDTLILDAGSFDGVIEGSRVVYGHVAIGTITRVLLHTSVAELYSTPGRITSMRIQHNGVLIPVDVEGRGGGEFSVMVPKDTEVALGDTVFLPGMTPSIFGRVDAVDTTMTSSFQNVFIALPVHIGSLRFVEIISDGSPDIF